MLLSWGDEIAPGLKFGFNNDYLAFIPLDGKTNEGILWVNHEYPSPFFSHGFLKGMKKVEID